MQYLSIVDDEGDIWPADDAGLSRYMRTHRAGADLQTVLISSLGFIGLTVSAKRIDLCFNPEAVSPNALGGLLYWFRENTFLPTRIHNPLKADLVSLFATRADVIAHLSDRLAGRKCVSTVSRIALPLEQSAFATRWRAAIGICVEVERPAPRNRLLGDLFQGYFSVLERAEGGECTIQHLGDAYAGWEPDFHRIAVGRTFRDVFDKQAGSLLADGYRDIARSTTEPRAESVRALINFPTKPARRLNYDRIILPIGTSRLLVANFAH
jgi:hypothetical protein